MRSTAQQKMEIYVGRVIDDIEKVLNYRRETITERLRFLNIPGLDNNAFITAVSRNDDESLNFELANLFGGLRSLSCEGGIFSAPEIRVAANGHSPLVVAWWHQAITRYKINLEGAGWSYLQVIDVEPSSVDLRGVEDGRGILLVRRKDNCGLIFRINAGESREILLTQRDGRFMANFMGEGGIPQQIELDASSSFLRVIDDTVAKRPDGMIYQREGDEFWDDIRELADRVGGAMPSDDALIEELSGPARIYLGRVIADRMRTPGERFSEGFWEFIDSCRWWDSGRTTTSYLHTANQNRKRDTYKFLGNIVVPVAAATAVIATLGGIGIYMYISAVAAAAATAEAAAAAAAVAAAEAAAAATAAATTTTTTLLATSVSAAATAASTAAAASAAATTAASASAALLAAAQTAGVVFAGAVAAGAVATAGVTVYAILHDPVEKAKLIAQIKIKAPEISDEELKQLFAFFEGVPKERLGEKLTHFIEDVLRAAQTFDSVKRIEEMTRARREMFACAELIVAHEKAPSTTALPIKVVSASTLPKARPPISAAVELEKRARARREMFVCAKVTAHEKTVRVSGEVPVAQKPRSVSKGVVSVAASGSHRLFGSSTSTFVIPVEPSAGAREEMGVSSRAAINRCS